MIISPHEQRSPEWLEERLGLPTASCFELIVDTKGNRSKSAEKYMLELAGEAITRRQAERFVSWKMLKAAEREPDARNFYQLCTGNEVREVGLCYLNEHKMFGASPDGLIDPDGGFETKDAEPHIQITRLLKGWSRADHFQQCQGGMLVCERSWWDLQSYCEGMDPVNIHYERDEPFIKKLEVELEKFSFELALIIKKLKGG